eukprot:TRINITY_DN5421_c0_g1_i1.p1 TRINITY_DN5421_c0_g1~~TRINITY_DN5421_c0_g1_i1.p1  ORF type:complete len:122 (+),score=53.65 TRINITY_DN5421_c0_g1_i1:97-462(+)
MSELPMKGKILKKPYPHMWFKIPESDHNEEHKYTCELNKDWTPFNSNLHMQGIKVRVNNPVPETSGRDGSFEDTMLLLDMMKEKKRQDKMKNKEEMIREMAMKQKEKQEEKQRAHVFKASF